MIPDRVTLSPSFKANTSVSLVILALGEIFRTLTFTDVEAVDPSSSVTVAVICRIPMFGHEAVNSNPVSSQSLSVIPSLLVSTIGLKSQQTISESISDAVSLTTAVKVRSSSSKIGWVEPRLSIVGGTFVIFTIPVLINDCELSLS